MILHLRVSERIPSWRAIIGRVPETTPEVALAYASKNPMSASDGSSERFAVMESQNSTLLIFSQRLIPVARWALIYAVSDIRPRMLLLRPRDDWDPACGSAVAVEDLDTEEWMAGPTVVHSVDYLPGTACYLANGYDIICEQNLTGRSRETDGAANETINRLFSLNWTGNVIVIKRGRFDRGRAVHITAPEISAISAILQRFVPFLFLLFLRFDR